MSLISLFIFFIFFTWAGSFFFRTQLILTLLRLELVLLISLVTLIISFSQIIIPVRVALFMLVLGVIEASVGLSLLISLRNQLGSDLLVKLWALAKFTKNLKFLKRAMFR